MRIVDLDTIIKHFKSLNVNVIDISVLEGLPSIHTLPCEDIISRTDAIRNIREQFSYGECYCDEYSIVGIINNLPPIYDEIRV